MSLMDLGELLGDKFLNDNGVSTPLNTMKRREQGYLDSHRDIDPIKLAHRLEAIWQSGAGLAIDLFSGVGELAFWYRRRFQTIVTVDKVVEDVDFNISALKFIDTHLLDYLGFDFIDFDDEGSPVREITRLFEVISGKKTTPFYMALTDGCGLNLKIRGLFDFGLYRQGDTKRKATTADYVTFEDMVYGFVMWKSAEYGFTATNLSNYRGREGNVVFQTWLIEPNCAELSGAGYDSQPANTAEGLS